MNSEKLTHLIYCSAATPQFNLGDLKAILQIARSNNAQESVTGMLLCTSGSFFQVLEGDEATVTKLFARLSLDPRHRDVTKIIHEPIARRSFGDWTMGFSEVTPTELETIEGLNPTVLSRQSYGQSRRYASILASTS